MICYMPGPPADRCDQGGGKSYVSGVSLSFVEAFYAAHLTAEASLATCILCLDCVWRLVGVQATRHAICRVASSGEGDLCRTPGMSLRAVKADMNVARWITPPPTSSRAGMPVGGGCTNGSAGHAKDHERPQGQKTFFNEANTQLSRKLHQPAAPMPPMSITPAGLVVWWRVYQSTDNSALSFFD